MDGQSSGSHPPDAASDVASLRAEMAQFHTYLLHERGASVNTLITYGAALNSFAAWYATGQMKDYRHPQFPELSLLLTHLREGKGLAPSSVCVHLSAVKSFYHFLLLEERVKPNQIMPIEVLEAPAKWERLPSCVSAEDVEKLIRAVNPDEDRYYYRDVALLETLYATGCRASELCAMKLVNLHLDEQSILIDGKGKKQRIALLGAPACTALDAYLARQRPQLVIRKPFVEALFVTNRATPLTRYLIWIIVNKYAERSGVERHVHPHVLRHSFATHLLKGGISIREVQELLGHESILTTQRYTHVDPTDMKTLHRKFHPRGGGELRLYDDGGEEQRKAA